MRWLLLIVFLVGLGVWLGWKLQTIWLEIRDDLARNALPSDLRAQVDACRSAERMTWLTARAVYKLEDWRR